MGIRLEAEPIAGEVACPLGSSPVSSSSNHCFRVSADAAGIGENNECAGTLLELGGEYYSVASPDYDESLLQTSGAEFQVAAPDGKQCSAGLLTVKMLGKVPDAGYTSLSGFGDMINPQLPVFNDDWSWFEYRISDPSTDTGEFSGIELVLGGVTYLVDSAFDPNTVIPGTFNVYLNDPLPEPEPPPDPLPIDWVAPPDPEPTHSIFVVEVKEIQAAAPDAGFVQSETLVFPGGERGAGRWSITDFATFASVEARTDLAGAACSSRTEKLALHQNVPGFGTEISVEANFDESMLKTDGASFYFFATFFCSLYTVAISEKVKACPEGYFYNAELDICQSIVEYEVELDADRESQKSGDHFVYTDTVHGLKVFNDSNKVMLNSDMKQFHYYGKAAYHSLINSHSEYGGMGFHTYDIYLSKDIFPLVFIRPADYLKLHALLSVRTVGEGRWICDVAVGGIGTEPPEIHVFVTPDSVEEPDDRYGMQTFTGEGELSFDSRRKPLVIFDGGGTHVDAIPSLGGKNLNPAVPYEIDLSDDLGTSNDDLMFSAPSLAHAEREYTESAGDTWCFPCCSCEIYKKWWKSIDVNWAFYRNGFTIEGGKFKSGWITFLSGNIHRHQSGSGLSLFGMIDLFSWGERDTASGSPPLRNDSCNVTIPNTYLITKVSRYV